MSLGINQTGQVSVGTTPTLIAASNGLRYALLITNISSTVTVYIGNSAVTASNGQVLGPGQSLTIPVVGPVYGVVASGTQTVSFIEVA